LIFDNAQALNFFAFGTLLPSRYFSAPVLLPLAGQPYLGEQAVK
jgi:hypothetical protein